MTSRTAAWCCSMMISHKVGGPDEATQCLQAVDELQQLLGAPADTAVPRPAWHYNDGRAPQSEGVPLREALAMCYDLR